MLEERLLRLQREDPERWLREAIRVYGEREMLRKFFVKWASDSYDPVDVTVTPSSTPFKRISVYAYTYRGSSDLRGIYVWTWVVKGVSCFVHPIEGINRRLPGQKNTRRGGVYRSVESAIEDILNYIQARKGWAEDLLSRMFELERLT